MNPWIGTFVGWCLSWVYGRTGGDFRMRLIYVKRIWLPWWMRIVGQTWGQLILIRDDNRDPKVLPHEEVHVKQWERCGFWGLGFMVAYLWEWIKKSIEGRSFQYGYWNNKFEKEAREAE